MTTDEQHVTPGGESCAERASNSLDLVRRAWMDVQNALDQDDCYEAWDEVVGAASELEYAAEQLGRKARDESRKAEEALPDA